MRRVNWIVGVAALLWVGAAQAKADIITFDAQGLNGPSTFSQTSEQTINVTSPGGVGVTLTGGTILTNTSNLPADQTSLYGTAGFAGANYTNPLVITFNQPVQNFIADLFNGSTITANFMVSDGLGDSAVFSIPSNLSSGQHTIFFAAAGTSVTITQLTNDPNVSGYDFFIDNVQFNVPLAGVPEPATLTLFAISLAGMGAYGWRRRIKAAS